MEVGDVSQGGQMSYGIFNSSNVDSSESTTVSNNVVSVKSESNDQKNISLEEAKKAADKLNKLIEDTPTHLEYEIHGKFNDVVVKVVDDKTKEVVQEIPPEKIIDMVDKLCELAGIFMDKKV